MKTDQEIQFRKEIKTNFAYNLDYWTKKRNIKQVDIVNKLNVSKSTVSTWFNSNSPKMPSTETIQKLANILDINMSDLLESDIISNPFASIGNIIPIPRMVKKPRLGTIACGEPILATENIEAEDFVPEYIICDFTLICKGDSMVNARINDGDIVYIKHQEQVENGEIAACLVEGEFDTNATLKRFYKYDDKIILQSENPKYQPFVFVNEEMNKVRIIGKAVGFTSKL